jgi:assimilatory nitrate reductase electron transfer subunit
LSTVIVGSGMAATRLVEELVARGHGDLVVLGDEPYPPYNRILLSAVLEGTHRPESLTLREPVWYADHGVDLRLGVRVGEVDRGRHEVVLVDGTRLGYDRLVLATGSIPTLPPIRGLVRDDGSLHPQVHAFRSLDDCRRLLDAVEGLRRGRPARAVVVGGGLLGLQVTRALSVRGLMTEVVEGGEHLLRSQVGAPAGAVLERGLERLGTTVYTGTRAVRLTGEGLVLDNGYVLETDLVVLTAGGRPSTALASRAGLTVRRGIVVDDQLRSVDDPHIHAVGDCAAHEDRTTGFVPPAWEQAGLVAAHLSGDDVSYRPGRSVARLRATGLDVAVLGDPERTDGQVVEMTNPVLGTHRKLVVADGVIVGATLVGDLSRIGLLTQHYDRGTVLGPDEPGALLLGASTTSTGVVDLPDDVEICACAGVTAGRIRGCGSLDEVTETTRAGTGCGGCAPAVRQLLATRHRPTLEGTRR